MATGGIQWQQQLAALGGKSEWRRQLQYRAHTSSYSGAVGMVISKYNFAELQNIFGGNTFIFLTTEHFPYYQKLSKLKQWTIVIQ